jgi:hypothetical protein
VAADPVTRVSLSIQQMMGLNVGSFGMGDMTTSRPVTEIMA